jgi:hypothetical protein
MRDEGVMREREREVSADEIDDKEVVREGGDEDPSTMGGWRQLISFYGSQVPTGIQGDARVEEPLNQKTCFGHARTGDRGGRSKH